MRIPERLMLGLSLVLVPACSSDGDVGDSEVGDTGTESDSESETTSDDGSTDSTDTGTDSTDTGTESTDSESDTETDTDTSDTGGVFTLTSPAFVEGGVIPDANACFGGANISPQLDWVDAPPGTLGFAVFFLDLSTNFNHSAIFDIPADADGLPEDVDKTAMPADVPGATQPRSYANNFGYAGPCPGSMHTYEFTVYAIDVANIAEIDQDSSLAAVKTALEAHSLGEASLSGDFTPPP